MRLMVDAIEIEDRKDGRFIDLMKNDTGRPEEYKAFRRFAMHLEALQAQDQLFVNNLIFDKLILDNVKEPWNNDPSKLAIAVEDGFRWQRNNDDTYTVMKRTIGRVLISNYDPHALPGGEVPLFGAISLRSLLKILWAVSNGIGDHQQNMELNVAPDPRTVGSIGDNPRQTLAINVSDNAPPGDVVHAHYKGRYYWVNENIWDWTAFMMLNTIFQFTVTDVSDVGIPITIAK